MEHVMVDLGHLHATEGAVFSVFDCRMWTEVQKTLTFFRQMGSFATHDFFETFIHRDE